MRCLYTLALLATLAACGGGDPEEETPAQEAASEQLGCRPPPRCYPLVCCLVPDPEPAPEPPCQLPWVLVDGQCKLAVS